MLRVLVIFSCFICLITAFVENSETNEAGENEHQVTEVPEGSSNGTTAEPGIQAMIIVRACRSGLQRASEKLGCRKPIG